MPFYRRRWCYSDHRSPRCHLQRTIKTEERLICLVGQANSTRTAERLFTRSRDFRFSHTPLLRGHTPHRTHKTPAIASLVSLDANEAYSGIVPANSNDRCVTVLDIFRIGLNYNISWIMRRPGRISVLKMNGNVITPKHREHPDLRQDGRYSPYLPLQQILLVTGGHPAPPSLLNPFAGAGLSPINASW